MKNTFSLLLLLALTACGSDQNTDEPIQNKSILTTVSGVSVTENPIENNISRVQEPASTREATSTRAIQRFSNRKKVFILGDSTVYNESKSTEMGWGTALVSYGVHPENIFNQARSGASAKSYKICNSQPQHCAKNHNWENIKKLINTSAVGEGAYLLIQFGHNDEKKNNPIKSTLPGRGNSFYNELKVFTDEARKMGITPVLMTPVERMEKKSGENLKYSHIKKQGDYAQTVRDLASDEDILLLDLQKKSWVEFNKYSSSATITKAFAYDDVTHFSPKGASKVASWVKELACTLEDKGLCSQFK